MNRTIDTNLYLAGSLMIGRDAKIDIHRLAYTVFDVESTVVLQLLGLLLDEEEHQHECHTDQQGDKGEQPFVLNRSTEANATPTETDDEVDEDGIDTSEFLDMDDN